MIHVKIQNLNGDIKTEQLELHCKRLSKKNNSVLFKLEEYLGKELLNEKDLQEIRSIILDVSADINRLPNRIIGGDYD